MHYQTIVIGFGKGGKTLAGQLAKKGEKVALIEKDSRMYGGTCINVGCLPTKRLVMLSEKAPRGDFSAQAEYYRQAITGKEQMTGAFREVNYAKLVQAGVEVIDGLGSFEDAHSIRVQKSNGETLILKGDKIIINTGSTPFIPDIKGLQDSKQVYLSETLLNLEELPRQLTIIGGGYIGLEFASMYTNFGSQVTVLQDSTIFLPKEDQDMAQAIHHSLEAKGVKIITGTKITEIEGGQVLYEKDGQSYRLEGDAILLATGRRPNTASLNVEKAGLQLTSRGAIAVNDHNRTAVNHIWAAGDVIGGLQFTYVSLDDSRIIWDDMFGQGARTTKNRGAFAYAVFLTPPFARVGLSEEEAKAQNLDYRVVTMPAAAIPKAKVLMEPEGLLKALIDTKTGYILGAQLFCAEAHELINMIKLAMDYNLPYTALRDFMYTHPTMAEGFNDLFAL